MGKGFDVLNKAKPRKRERDKSQKKEKITEPRTDIPIFLIPIHQENPPDTNERILIWDAFTGFDIIISSIVRQHLEHDISLLGYSRTRLWAKLENRE